MVGIVKAAHTAGLPVTRGGVLQKVVGADAEKVAFMGQTVADKHRRRGFDHNAQRHIFIVGNALLLQLGHYDLAHFAGLTQLPHGCNDGKHNGQLAKGAGAVDGAQLGAEHSRAGKAQAQRAHTHGRIGLGLHMKIACLLVGADIQCADDHAFAPHLQGCLTVGQKLVFLAGVIVLAQIQKFASEKPHAAAVVFLNGLQILRRGDVAHKAYGAPILRYVFFALQAGEQLTAVGLLRLLLLQPFPGAVVRVYDHQPRIAVNGGLAPAVAPFEQIAHLHHGGNAQTAGQNGRVACGRAL